MRSPALVNDVLRRYHPNIVATLCLALLDPVTGELDIVNCGHIPPLIVSDGVASYVGQGGLMLGLPMHEPHTHRAVPPGGTVLLITDGLIEERPILDDNMDKLRLAAQQVGRADIQAFTNHLMALFGPREDDVAMIAVRGLAPGAGAGTAGAGDGDKLGVGVEVPALSATATGCCSVSARCSGAARGGGRAGRGMRTARRREWAPAWRGDQAAAAPDALGGASIRATAATTTAPTVTIPPVAAPRTKARRSAGRFHSVVRHSRRSAGSEARCAAQLLNGAAAIARASGTPAGRPAAGRPARSPWTARTPMPVSPSTASADSAQFARSASHHFACSLVFGVRRNAALRANRREQPRRAPRPGRSTAR